MGGRGGYARYFPQAACAGQKVSGDTRLVFKAVLGKVAQETSCTTLTATPNAFAHALVPKIVILSLHAGERPGIVVLTIGLEESLPKLPGAVIPSKLWSPYRLPLIRFLNQYPADRQVSV